MNTGSNLLSLQKTITDKWEDIGLASVRIMPRMRSLIVSRLSMFWHPVLASGRVFPELASCAHPVAGQLPEESGISGGTAVHRPNGRQLLAETKSQESLVAGWHERGSFCFSLLIKQGINSVARSHLFISTIFPILIDDSNIIVESNVWKRPSIDSATPSYSSLFNSSFTFLSAVLAPDRLVPWYSGIGAEPAWHEWFLMFPRFVIDIKGTVKFANW